MIIEGKLLKDLRHIITTNRKNELKGYIRNNKIDEHDQLLLTALMRQVLNPNISAISLNGNESNQLIWFFNETYYNTYSGIINRLLDHHQEWVLLRGIK